MYKCGKGDAALAEIETYYNGRPELWDDHLLVKSAVLYHGARDCEGCIAGLQELLAAVDRGKLSSLVPTVRELMCKALRHIGRIAEAATTLEAMAADSGDPLWLSQAGQAFYEARNYPSAKRAYKAAIRHSGASDDLRAMSMYGLALCYWDTGFKQASSRLMRDVSERYPGTEGARKARGSLYLQADKP